MVIYPNICFIFKQNTRNRLCNFIAVGHELQADKIAALILYKIHVCVQIYIFCLNFFYIFSRAFTHQFQKAQVSIHFHKLFEHQLPPFFWHTFSYTYTENRRRHLYNMDIDIDILAWWKPKIRIEFNLFCFGLDLIYLITWTWNHFI